MKILEHLRLSRNIKKVNERGTNPLVELEVRYGHLLTCVTEIPLWFWPLSCTTIPRACTDRTWGRRPCRSVGTWTVSDWNESECERAGWTCRRRLCRRFGSRTASHLRNESTKKTIFIFNSISGRQTARYLCEFECVPAAARAWRRTFRSKDTCSPGCVCARASRKLERTRTPCRSVDTSWPVRIKIKLVFRLMRYSWEHFLLSDRPASGASGGVWPSWRRCCSVCRTRGTRGRRSSGDRYLWASLWPAPRCKSRRNRPPLRQWPSWATTSVGWPDYPDALWRWNSSADPGSASCASLKASEMATASAGPAPGRWGPDSGPVACHWRQGCRPRSADTRPVRAGELWVWRCEGPGPRAACASVPEHCGIHWPAADWNWTPNWLRPIGRGCTSPQVWVWRLWWRAICAPPAVDPATWWAAAPRPLFQATVAESSKPSAAFHGSIFQILQQNQAKNGGHRLV